MKKTILIIASLLISFVGISQTAGNYILVINNDTLQIDLDKQVSYQTKGGEELAISITQPEVLTYSDDMISFSYSKQWSVSNSELEEGIEQCMVVNSTGNGFMIQKYNTLDPSSLTRLMLREITKESVSYGYRKTESKFVKKLKSGQRIEGVRARLSYQGEEEIYTVATYGEDDRGIVVVTMLLSSEEDEGKDLINLFMNTLAIKD